MEGNTGSLQYINTKSSADTFKSNEIDLKKINSIIEQYLLHEIDFSQMQEVLNKIKDPELQRFVVNLKDLIDKREKEFLKKDLQPTPDQNIAVNFYHLAELFPYPAALVNFSNGKIIHVNSKCLDLLCIENSDFSRKNFYEIFVFEENLSEFKENLLIDGAVFSFETEVARDDSSFFLASMTASMFKSNYGQEFVVSLMNVEEEKMLTEERERLLEELTLSRAQIEEEAGRYVQVNLQLAESEEKLQDLNATKDKFFSIIGHDLKNPLFVIQSMSEILENDYDEISEEERISFIKAVRESANSATMLLEDLLHWARCQSGRIDYNPEPISIERIVSDLFSLVEAQALKKHILLLSHINPQHYANADKFMITTILRNLVSNAIKFTENGGRVMVVSKEINEMIEIGVIDSGMGMTPEDVSKLFRIEVKNCEIGRSKEKGTGLGLILCKEFTERHGGRIWVESEFGKGSKFKFTVPKLT